MFLWRKNRPRRYERTDVAQEIIFKRHECEWILPLSLASHLRFNPRHLPMVQGKPTNEDYYLKLSIRRILRGYCATKESTCVPS